MALTKITKSGLTADLVDETKIADNAISEEHLDITSLTGHTELSATAADDDVLLVYDTSAGTLKKIQKSNVSLAVPTFSSVSPTSLTTGDLTGNYTIVVTGTKFDANATFKLRTSDGTDISMDSVSRDSSTQLTGTVAKNTANLTNANEPFDVIITNGSGLSVTTTNQINVDAQPVYVTAAGSLGTGSGGTSVSFSVNATDPESAGNVTFELQSGTLPAGLSLTNTAAEGGTAIISGTATNPASNTTYNFTLRAVDAASNTSSRAFSITINRTVTSESFTSSGTFSVPSGVTAVDVLVVGGGGGGGCGSPGAGARRGGGGGAGGLIFFPEYPVSPGGTMTVTVGCGGGGGFGKAGQDGQQGCSSSFGSPGDPGLGSGGVLTAQGGGGGGGLSPSGCSSGSSGGSGGGGSGDSSGQYASSSPGTQSTQPGNSGAYGFGNNGGNASVGGAGGGGGAGGNGFAGGACSTTASQGGVGKAYTISDGTTPVYYAGGGGGAFAQNISPFPPTIANGGQGGGGQGSVNTDPCRVSSGTANRGGGGGGSDESPNPGKCGGKGIVIVRY